MGTRFEIVGPGVLHVRASEILKTQNAKNQLKALKKIKVGSVRVINERDRRLSDGC